MTASPNNITLTKEVNGTDIRVTIATTRVEQIWSKRLSLVTTPITTAKRTDDANTTKIVDLLLKAEKRFSVDGRLQDGVGTARTSPTERYNCSDKKADLKKIFYGGGVCTLNWEGDDYTVGFEKSTINWQANDKSTVTSYTVKFTAVEGVDM